MSEITLDDLPTPGPRQPPFTARPPIQYITTWVEKFALMASLLATRFPEKASELFAYQAPIVRAERNFEGRRWVTYDRRNWTGRPPTSACTMRHSLATRKRSHGARTASRRTTPLSHAHATPAGRGLACTMTQRVALSSHQVRERSPQSAAGGTTRANAAKEQIPVAMHIGVRHAEAHTPTRSAAGELFTAPADASIPWPPILRGRQPLLTELNS